MKEHPDGDPFALADQARDRATPLGRMEQRAQAEHGPVQSPPLQSTPQPGRTASHSSVERKIETIDIDDSDEEPPSHDRTPDSRRHRSESHLEPTREGTPDDENATEHTLDEHNQLDTTMHDPDEEDEATEEDPEEEEEEEEEDSEEDDDDENETSINIGAEVDLTSAQIIAVSPGTLPAAQPSPQKATLGDIVLPDLANLPPIPSDPAAPLAPVVAKPVSTRAPRVRSPSPPPPKPVVPAVTVRLEIILPPLGSADVPMYSVAELEKEAGYGLDPEEDKDDSESDGHGSGDEGGDKKKAASVVPAPIVSAAAPIEARTATGEVVPTPLAPAVPAPKKRQRKFLGRNDGYDVEDPFVDDSELALFEPKYYHRPKRDGFFVNTGVLELISDTQPIGRSRVAAAKSKPKSEAEIKAIASIAAARANSGSAVASTSKARQGSATATFDDAGPTVSSVPAFGSGSLPPVKKPKLAGAFSPELQAEFDMLKREAAKESFEPRNKFPQRLKELLIETATKAYLLDEYNDEFFGHLPSIFPYNNFTLKKLVKREFHSTHMRIIEDRQAELVELMKENIAESLPLQQVEFEEHYASWSVKHAQLEAAKAAAGDDPTTTPDLVGQDAVQGVVMEGSTAAAVATAPPEIPEPKKKFKFSDNMRLWLHELVMLEDQKATIIGEKFELEKQGQKAPSVLSLRKAIYASLVRHWPDDWMSTNYLSREMSAAKKKYDREHSKLVKSE